MTRRKMIRATALGSGVIGVLLSVPALGFVLSPLFESRRTRWVEVGKPGEIDAVAVDKPTPFVVDMTTDAGPELGTVRRIVYVVRTTEGELLALSNICTHMQCDVHWDASITQFFCPCHAGYYDMRGTNIGGPPPSPLPQWIHRLSKNEIGQTRLEVQNRLEGSI